MGLGLVGYIVESFLPLNGTVKVMKSRFYLFHCCVWHQPIALLASKNSFFFFFFLLGPHLQHMEVSRLGVESEL